MAPLLIDGVQQDNLWIFPNINPEQFFLESTTLEIIFSKLLRPDLFQNFQHSILPAHVVSQKSLQTIGVILQFDEKNLQLHLVISPLLRKQENLSIRQEQSYGGEPVEQALFSGYINTHSIQSYQYPITSSSHGNIRQPFQSKLDLNSNYATYILESSTQYTEKSTKPWQRQDIKLTHDLEDHLLRISVGEFSTSGVGFQTGREIGGVSISKNFSISPLKLFQPLNRTSIILKRPSMVEIYVNGAFATRINHIAGPLELRDYPLVSGQNDVELRITNDVGEVETTNLSLFHDSTLLQEGLHQFTYQVGNLQESTTNSRIYTQKDPFASFFHRMGLSDRLTAGTNIQIDNKQQLFGVDAFSINKIGVWSIDAAHSKNKNFPADMAMKVHYKTLDRYGATASMQHAAVDTQYFGKYFSVPGSPSPANPYSYLIDANYSITTPFHLRAGLGYRYQISRSESIVDRKMYRFDAGKRIANNWDANLSYSITRDNKNDHRIYIALSWNSQNGDMHSNTTYDSPRSSLREDLSYNSKKLQLAAALQQTDTEKSGELRGDYAGERASLHFNHSSTLPRPAGAANNLSSLSLGTAFAWAGNHWGISRPISDSFVLISAANKPTSITLPINSVYPDCDASINSFGSAILPDIASYYPKQVSIDTNQLPLGLHIKKENFLAKPKFHSGVSIHLPIEESISLKGKFLNTLGEPLALQAGDILNKKEAKVEGQFFTNRQGIFFLEGLIPGEYEFHFYDNNYEPSSLKIEAGKTGLLQIPDTVVRAIQ